MEFWKTNEWLEYLLNSKIENPYIDHSFYLNDKFIILLQNEQEFYSPYIEDDKKILEHIKDLAIQHNINRIQVDFQIKSYLNISQYTCILDLNNVKLTKGCKSAIKKANKYLTYIIDCDINDFKKDYFTIAGKQTRPDKTFEILDEWIKRRYGTLLTAIHDNKRIGHVYVLHYQRQAYYFMSCVFPEYKDLNVSHYLQTQAFNILLDKGITQYEMGDQSYNNLFTQPTDKEFGISKFKRSFGGQIILKPKSEYFFDLEHMKQVYTERINKYVERQNEIINFSKT